jgi:hypothetical protein
MRKAQDPVKLVAREQRADVQQQQLLQRQEPRLAIGGGQAHEAVDLAGDRQQRLQLPPVLRAPHLQRQRSPSLGMNGNGCAGSMASGDRTGNTRARNSSSGISCRPPSAPRA